MNIIWLDKDSVLNLDHIVSVDFFTQNQLEQDGRKTYDGDSIDESMPYSICDTRMVAEVKFDFTEDVENYAGSLENSQASRRYYGERAESIYHFLNKNSAN